MEHLAVTLSKQLKEANMKPSQLAQRSGTSKSYICRVLQGQRANPSAQMIQAWAMALGCSVESFFMPSL